MTTTGTEAFQAMLAHHAALADGVDRRVAALRAAVGAGSGHGPASAELVAYVASEVLPHATAEEHTLYRAAASVDGLAATVAGMVDEHRRLAAAVEHLATAAEASDALRTADAFGSLFSAHVAKENELILPPLEASEGVDLAGLLLQMHRLTEAAQEPGSIGADAADTTLDVRSLAPARRHQEIFGAYGALPPGSGFVLVNDHDPKPLRYQFEAEHAGEFTWDYLEAGPDVWRVRIGRAAGAPK